MYQADFNTGSARSVGRQRIMKHYEFLDGTVVAARSASIACSLADKLLEVPKLTDKPVGGPTPPAEPEVAKAVAEPVAKPVVEPGAEPVVEPVAEPGVGA